MPAFKRILRFSLAAAAALTVVLVAVSSCCADNGSRIAFVRRCGDESWIYTADADGRNVLRAAAGYDPEISPDGSRIAYTHEDANGLRRIAIFKQTSRKSSFVTEATGNESYGPRWSHDGTRLLFNGCTPKGRWQPVIYDMATGRRCAAKPPASWQIGYSLFWSSNDETFYAQDLKGLCGFNATTGRPIKEYSFGSLFSRHKAVITCFSRFCAPKSGRAWLVCCEDGKTLCRQCAAYAGSGRKGILCLYRPAAGTLVRIPLKNLCVMDACWLNADKAIFSAHRTDTRPNQQTTGSDLYTIDLRTKRVSLLLSNGCCVSASR